MQTRALTVPHALEVTPVIHRDARGEFAEWFRADALREATGREFDLAQANLSQSSRGVARGIHFADVPLGQAKYVTVVAGSVLDIVVDLRVGSPAFGTWDSVELDANSRRAVFVPEGVGHLFVATSESATVCYLMTDVYQPQVEHEVNPLDPQLGLVLPLPEDELVLADKDRAAPSLARALAAGILPQWEACLARYEQAARTGGAQ